MQQTDHATLTEAEQRWLSAWNTGPLRTRWTSLPLQPGDPAPDAVLPDSEGAPVRLSDHWREAPVVLVFLRHFGCSCAAGRVERLVVELPKLREAGAHVLCIGQGEPDRAKAFKALRKLEVPLLCDPARKTYGAYGLLEGHPAQIVYGAPDDYLRRDPEAGRSLQLSRLGTPRTVVDNPWQLPGDFVIDRGGTIRLAHRPAHCDGLLDSAVLAAVIREGQLAG